MTVFANAVRVGATMTANELKQKEGEIEALVLECQDGSHQAFERLYELFVDPIYRYIYYRVNAAEVEDLVETVFMKVWEKIHQYKPKKKTTFSSWIFRIAHNLVVDTYRAQTDRHVEELDPNLMSEDGIADPKSATQQALDQGTLRSALSRLKKPYREVLIHKFINDLSNKEIADILDKSEGSLRILQFRALKALKKELEDEGIS